MAGAASSSASSSCVRSRSCASSTRSRAQRSRQAASTRRIGLEEPERTDDEVVEVDAAELRDRALVGDERARDRARGRVARDVVGRDAKVELEPREREVQPAAVGRGGLRKQLAQERVAVDERLDRDARLGEHLASEGVERPDPDRARRQAEGRQRRVEPVGQLLGRPPVERHDADRPGVRSAVDEPGHPRDQGRRLAGPRRGNAQHRPGRRGRGGPLVRGEPAEALGDRRVGHACSHRYRVARRAHPALNGRRRVARTRR